jgi:hypothetical protein
MPVIIVGPNPLPVMGDFTPSSGTHSPIGLPSPTGKPPANTPADRFAIRATRAARVQGTQQAIEAGGSLVTGIAQNNLFGPVTEAISKLAIGLALIAPVSSASGFGSKIPDAIKPAAAATATVPSRVIIAGPSPLPVHVVGGGHGHPSPAPSAKAEEPTPGVGSTAPAAGEAAGEAGAAEAVAGLGAAAGPAGVAVAAFAVALGATVAVVKVAAQAISAFAERGRELAPYSAALTAASARADIRNIQADQREAEVLGPKLAELIELQSNGQQALRELLLPIKEWIIDILNGLMKGLFEVAIGMLEALRKLIEIADGPLAKKLADIIDRVKAILAGAAIGGAGLDPRLAAWLAVPIGGAPPVAPGRPPIVGAPPVIGGIF